MGLRACLIDVWETVLHQDFSNHWSEMPLVAGVPPDEWHAAFMAHGDALNEGATTLAEVYGKALQTSGRDPSPEAVDALLRRDRELLIETTRVWDDVLPFLATLRSRGVATAFVSNCADGTRGLLDLFGLTALVDTVVLSCEVGATKPHPSIYRAALDELGVSAEASLFVDDQPTYCEGARLLGITARVICRDGAEPPPHERVVHSLMDLGDLF